MPTYRYDIAISFAGEDRKIAEDIAAQLDACGYSVFYDFYESARLWGADLPAELGEVYLNDARFCLILVSQCYISKIWTNHERHYAIARMMRERGEYILPLRLDDTPIPGLPPNIGYQSLIGDTAERFEEVLVALFKKLGKPRSPQRNLTSVTPEDRDVATKVLAVCNRRALFTRMGSEINLDAMFASLVDCIGKVQEFAPGFSEPSLQRLAYRLITAIDRLDRLRVPLRKRQRSRQMVREPDADILMQIDQEKLRAIRVLHEIRRTAGVNVQLPTELRYDCFFSQEEASAEPEKGKTYLSR